MTPRMLGRGAPSHHRFSSRKRSPRRKTPAPNAFAQKIGRRHGDACAACRAVFRSDGIRRQAVRQELRGSRIWGGFGLNEHDAHSGKVAAISPKVLSFERISTVTRERRFPRPTIVWEPTTGIGKAARDASMETSGPGHPVPEPAPKTRNDTSRSSSIRRRIWFRLLPVRTEVSTSATPRFRQVATWRCNRIVRPLVRLFLHQVPTPSQCRKSALSVTASIRSRAPVRTTRRLAKAPRAAFLGSVDDDDGLVPRFERSPEPAGHLRPLALTPAWTMSLSHETQNILHAGSCSLRAMTLALSAPFRRIPSMGVVGLQAFHLRAHGPSLATASSTSAALKLEKF